MLLPRPKASRTGGVRWKGGQEDPGASRVEIRLRAIPEGTELTFTHALLHDDDARRSHEYGWTGALDKLQAHFAGSTTTRDADLMND